MRIIAACLMCIVALPAAAQTAIHVERGAALAAQWCAQCHAIGETAQAQALADAPSFAQLAAEGVATPQNLRSKLLGNHPIMPEFPLRAEDIQALSAYIDSLKPAPPRAKAAPAAHPHARLSDIEAGEALVTANCSPCHGLEGDGQSPVAVAPVLSTLSERYPVEHLAEALAEGLLVGHPEVEMPEFVFQTDEVVAIIAYLASIQRR